jgi:hypothetical protein
MARVVREKEKRVKVAFKVIATGVASTVIVKETVQTRIHIWHGCEKVKVRAKFNQKAR